MDHCRTIVEPNKRKKKVKDEQTRRVTKPKRRKRVGGKCEKDDALIIKTE